MRTHCTPTLHSRALIELSRPEPTFHLSPLPNTMRGFVPRRRCVNALLYLSLPSSLSPQHLSITLHLSVSFSPRFFTMKIVQFMLRRLLLAPPHYILRVFSNFFSATKVQEVKTQARGTAHGIFPQPHKFATDDPKNTMKLYSVPNVTCLMWIACFCLLWCSWITCPLILAVNL